MKPKLRRIRRWLWNGAVEALALGTWWYGHRQRRRLPDHCHTCGYNLTGTLTAGRSECPECGAAIPNGAQHT